MRTFLAIEIPDKLKRKIDNFIADARDAELPIKWVQFNNLHITLKFLGEIDEPQKQEIESIIIDLCKCHIPFEMNLEGIGCFPHPRNPRVLWIGVKQGIELLTDISCEIEKKFSDLGFKEEKRFHAHLTIGRVKKACSVDSILSKRFISENFPVTSIAFFKSSLTSQGPVYEALAKFKLG